MSSQKEETIARLETISKGLKATFDQFAKDYALNVNATQMTEGTIAGDLANAMARLAHAQVGLEATRVAVEMQDIMREMADSVKD